MAAPLAATPALLPGTARAQVPLDAVPGWSGENPVDALNALRASCRSILARTAEPVDGRTLSPSAWQAPCEMALNRRPGGPVMPAAAPRRRRGRGAPSPGNEYAASVRRFFEENFVAVPAGDMLVTGYYEPVLRGSPVPTDHFTVPLLARPPDLVERNRNFGRVGADGKLTPLPDRAAIEAGALERQGLTLVWVDNAVDAFFLEIQGSGRIQMPDGKVMRVGYAGQNGQPYVPLPRIVAERSSGTANGAGMMGLRQWLTAVGPAAAAEAMRQNPSYVFFRKVDGLSLNEGPLGAMGIPLTPGRSVAVDPSVVPLGAPLFMSGERTRRLLVAQDTGGAIKGQRADLFFGWGDGAGAQAGNMRERAQMWMLQPRGTVMASLPGNGINLGDPELAPAPAGSGLRGLMLSPGSTASLSGGGASVLPDFMPDSVWRGTRGGRGPANLVQRRAALARDLARHELAIRQRQASQRGRGGVAGLRQIGELPGPGGGPARPVFTLD